MIEMTKLALLFTNSSLLYFPAASGRPGSQYDKYNHGIQFVVLAGP